MKKCLLKFKWVPVPREEILERKGLLGYWLKLASRAAFRKGTSTYCGYENAVEPGMWVGGIVGLKSILGVRNREKALRIMEELQKLGYITYTLEPGTKILTYRVTDWVLKCSGAECCDGVVYTTDGYGFLCMPRNITERLAEQGRVFEESDAWLDLWCHTVWRDYGNAFSFEAPAIQYGKFGSVLTLQTLGKRWGWEKTKVWRFFQKYACTFPLYRLPGSFGCVIFNMCYPAGQEIAFPEAEKIKRIMAVMRISRPNTHYGKNENEHLNCLVAWVSRKLLKKRQEESAQNQSGDSVSDPDEHGESTPCENESDSRVALSAPILRAYFSHGRNCKYDRNCIYDCQGVLKEGEENSTKDQIGILCPCAWNIPFF